MKLFYTVEDTATGKHAKIKRWNFGTYVGPKWDGNPKGPFPPVKAWPRNPDGSLAFIVGHYYTVGEKGRKRHRIGRVVKLIGQPQSQRVAGTSVASAPSVGRMPNSIPSFVVEYFLLGRTRQDAIEHYTQDGGIVTDVWLAFGRDTYAYQRVLVAPSIGCSAVDLGHSLHQAIVDYRHTWNTNLTRVSAGVSPLENFVAVTLYFDELMRIVFPLTSWWHRKNLGALQREANKSARKLDDMLERAIRIKLGRQEEETNLRNEILASGTASPDGYPDRRILEAAPLAALIGVFYAARSNANLFDAITQGDLSRERQEEKFVEWVGSNAELIALEARKELARQYDTALITLREKMRKGAPVGQTPPEDPPEMIQRVFLDRQATLATEDEALCTIKADAAYRVFDISCQNITWAIIDSGIATTHPAFLDHDARDRLGDPIVPPPHRIKATYDFTHIERIRNFDLTLNPDGTRNGKPRSKTWLTNSLRCPDASIHRRGGPRRPITSWLLPTNLSSGFLPIGG